MFHDTVNNSIWRDNTLIFRVDDNEKITLVCNYMIDLTEEEEALVIELEGYYRKLGYNCEWQVPF